MIGDLQREPGGGQDDCSEQAHKSASTAIARVVPAWHGAAARPDAEQGHGVLGRRARHARTARPAAAARLDAGGAGHARAGELPPPADPAREVHHARVAAGPERGAVLSRRPREPGRDDADHLHADRGPRVPAVRPHLSAAARACTSAPRTAAASSRCSATGRTARPRSSSSPTASASSASAISARTGWAFRSASWRCTPRAPECIRAAACRSCSTSAPTTKRCWRIRCTSALAASGWPAPSSTNWSRSSSRRRQAVFPGVLVQFEDFANHNAFRLLQRYRDRICSFNDDIQGTASVIGRRHLLGAARDAARRCASRRSCAWAPARPRRASRICWSPRCGPTASPSREARARCWLVDSKGLVVAERSGPRRTQEALRASRTRRSADFLGAVKALKPTAIIGVGATPNTFTREVIETMTQLNERPIVFALSNPTSRAECTAEQAYQWSGGKALFASGSPFDASRPTTGAAMCRDRATTPTSSRASDWA